MSRQQIGAIVRELRTHGVILGGLVALMWILVTIDFVLRGSLLAYGILPHRLIGLRGILFAPFLHGGFTHLIANTIPFVTLGWLIMLRETRDFFAVTAITMLVSGLGVWVFGNPYSIHIGASGVVFGYLGFLLLRGFFERSVIAIVLSVLVGFFYGGVLWGILPTQPGISWEGHLFGFLGGIIAARLLARRSRKSSSKS